MVGMAALAMALTLPGQIGFIRDDGMYALFARALAEGQGYVDLSQPGHPTASRYPIGFPALLAVGLWGSHGVEEAIARLQLLPPLCGAAFVAASFAYYRAQVGWPALAALGMAAVVAFHPALLMQSTVVMADLPYGAIALVALLATERALGPFGSRGRLAAGIGAGVLVAAACLTRYFGVALLIAAVAVMVHRRSWRTLGGFAVGFGPIMGAWLAFRTGHGGESYVSEVSTQFSRDAEALLTAGRSIMTVSLPQLGVPGWGNGPVPAAAIASLVLLGALAAGLWSWVKQPPGRTTAIAPLFLALTLALAAAMEVAYPSYRGYLALRYALPVLPLLLAALALCARRLPRGSWRGAGAVAIGLALASCLWADAGQLERHRTLMARTHGLADYRETQAFLRRSTPTDARLIGPYGHALTLYTGRLARTLPYQPTVTAHEVPLNILHDVIVKEGITHVVGMPQVSDGVDLTVQTLNAFNRAYPGLLSPVYVSKSGKFVVFEVVRP